MTTRENIPILLNDNEEGESLFWSIIRYARPFKGSDNCGKRDCTCRSDSMYSTLSILPTIEEQRESIASSVHELGARSGIVESTSQVTGSFKSFLRLFCCFPSTARENEAMLEPRSSILNNGPFVSDAYFIAQRQFY